MSNRSPFPSPPPELVEQWFNDSPIDRGLTLATQAARWGADQELEACCDWLAFETPEPYINALRASRRSKPPSLKEQALEALEHILHNSSTELGAETIRRALEALND